MVIYATILRNLKNQQEYLRGGGIGPMSTTCLYSTQINIVFSFAKRQQWYFCAPIYMSVGACYCKVLLSLVLDNLKVGYIHSSQGLINAVLALRHMCLLFDPSRFYIGHGLCILTVLKQTNKQNTVLILIVYKCGVLRGVLKKDLSPISM